MTTEQLEELKRLAESATAQNLATAQRVFDCTDQTIECPHCGGEGYVELEGDYCNYDDSALGVQFYGIGLEHGAAEAYFRAANPSAILDLIRQLEKAKAENELLRQKLDDKDSIIEQMRDSQVDKLLAMTDEQVTALTRLEGSNPEDAARLARQAMKLAVAKVDLATAQARIAELEAQGEPHCWECTATNEEDIGGEEEVVICFTDAQMKNYRDESGYAVRPLYIHAPQAVPEDPMDTPLPCDITIGAATFGKGVKLRLLVERARRHNDEFVRMTANNLNQPDLRKIGLVTHISKIAAAPSPEGGAA